LAEEYLVLVDENDNPIGMEEKMKCHLPNGKLHRAFTSLLFTKNGKLLLTKRSDSKMLWPTDWDGTFASHPRKSESYVSSAERRLPEELGISCRMDYLFKFEYHVQYKDIGSENEICGTLLGVIEENTTFELIKDEISEVRWITSHELKTELEKNPQTICPWMVIALYLIPSSDNIMLEKYSEIFTDWTKPEISKLLDESIKYHFPSNNWRLIN